MIVISGYRKNGLIGELSQRGLKTDVPSVSYRAHLFLHRQGYPSVLPSMCIDRDGFFIP